MEIESSDKSLIRVQNLSIRRSKIILDDVSWTVQKGENWVLLGANGSGKTSLLNALTAYLTPSSGTIELLGKRYGAYPWPELRKLIGFVGPAIQQRIEPNEEVLGTVISGRYAMVNYWGEPSDEDQTFARKLLEEVGCAHLIGQFWGNLSQGERQRILISRALMAEPKLLILDEPTTGLDPVAREHFLSFMQYLASRTHATGTSILLVTHHIDEIVPSFSHVLLLKSGKLLTAGLKSEVLTGANLSECFGEEVSLTMRDGHSRYSMEIPPQEYGSNSTHII